MLVLGIESATATASVGLVERDRVLAERTLAAPGSHAVSILPLIDQTLRQASAAPGDLDALAVSIGPGSFTGLRVGLSVAKGLALACGLGIAAVPTLEALAHCVAGHDRPVCPVLDARRGEAYLAAFRLRDGRLECVRTPRIVDIDEITAHIPVGARLFGDLVDTHGPFLRERLGHHADIVSGVSPSGAVVARLGVRRIESNGPDDLAELEPTYLQLCDAERKRNARC